MLDIVIPGSTLTITGSVLLVPLVLAVIGQEREVAITGVVAIAVAIGSTWWNDATGTGQTIYRISFYHRLRGARGGGRAGARAGDRAGRHEREPRDRAARHAGAARRHPRIARRGRDRARRARQDRLRQRRRGHPAGVRERRGRAGRRAGRAGAALPHHARGRLAGAARGPAGPPARGRRGRGLAADPQRAARHGRGDVAADQVHPLHRSRRASGWPSTSSRTSPRPRTPSCASGSWPKRASCSPPRSTTSRRSSAWRA